LECVPNVISREKKKFKSFWYVGIKNNFVKIKKYYFNIFIKKKHFKKQPLQHSWTFCISSLKFVMIATLAFSNKHLTLQFVKGT
jgi:hypothetical protein